MIKLNTPYHVAEENVTVTFTEVKNGGITGTYSNATLTGTLEGNVLSATFHNTAVNAVGLIELTFNENGFEGKWKNGLEPGPMRGKWNGECISEGGESPLPATLTPDQLKWIETKDSWDYEEAPKEWLDSKDFILAAMKKDESILEYVSENLKDDKELILAAVSKNGGALQYASEELKADKTVAIAAISNQGSALEFVSDDLKSDKEVVLIALLEDASPLEYASDDLKKDREVIEAAIKNDDCLSYLLNDNLSPEQKQCLEEGFSLEDFDEEYQGGDDGKVDWMKDKNFLSEAIKVDAHILKHASAELKADSELVIAAIKKDWTVISFADEKLQCDPEVLINKVISYSNGKENFTIENEDLNVFVNGEGFSDPAVHIESLLFKIEFLLLKNREKELQNFYGTLKTLVNSHHECFWILQAVSERLDEVFNSMENYIYYNKNEEATIIYNQVSALVDSFDFKLEFSPSLEFETYFNDSEINSNWDDCSWTDVEGEEGLPFTEFIMNKSSIQWDTESWSDVKFYNHAISRLWIGMQNYSLKQSRNGFDSDQVAVMFHEVIAEKFEAIQDSGNGHYGSYVFETVVEFLLGFPKNDYNLNESNREDLEDFNGWQYDLKKVGSACDCDLFDDWPGASEFAKRKMGK